jgi:hypothetical protein
VFLVCNNVRVAITQGQFDIVQDVYSSCVLLVQYLILGLISALYFLPLTTDCVCEIVYKCVDCDCEGNCKMVQVIRG